MLIRSPKHWQRPSLAVPGVFLAQLETLEISWGSMSLADFQPSGSKEGQGAHLNFGVLGQTSEIDPALGP